MNAPSEHVVHGMAGEDAPSDWPPIEGEELISVLPQVTELGGDTRAEPIWQSPRPFSAAAVVQLASERRIMVKRHDERVRSCDALEEEHRFQAHLRAGGLPVPAVFGDGRRTAFSKGRYVYEFSELLSGDDLYREAHSWTPYRSSRHAAAAGTALARLHRRAERFAVPERRPRPLLGSLRVVTAPDPVAAVRTLAALIPGCSEYLSTRDLAADLAVDLVPLQATALPFLTLLPPLWTHGDWHPSNLLWSPQGDRVAGVIDFGLSNRTTACYDLATALERACVDWLAPDEDRRVEYEQMAELVNAYRVERPLSAEEERALPHLLPLVHVEYALSEVAYFHSIVCSEENASLAYDGYLLGHLAWFHTRQGRALCDGLAAVLQEDPRRRP